MKLYPFVKLGMGVVLFFGVGWIFRNVIYSNDSFIISILAWILYNQLMTLFEEVKK